VGHLEGTLPETERCYVNVLEDPDHDPDAGSQLPGVEESASELSPEESHGHSCDDHLPSQIAPAEDLSDCASDATQLLAPQPSRPDGWLVDMDDEVCALSTRLVSPRSRCSRLRRCTQAWPIFPTYSSPGNVQVAMYERSHLFVKRFGVVFQECTGKQPSLAQRRMGPFITAGTTISFLHKCCLAFAFGYFAYEAKSWHQLGILVSALICIVRRLRTAIGYSLNKNAQVTCR
jgi:hypothetical protein